MMKANNSIIRFCIEDQAAFLFTQKLVKKFDKKYTQFVSVSSHKNAESSMAVAN